MKNGCLPPNARMEKYKRNMKTLRSPYIDYWNCLNIKKVKAYKHKVYECMYILYHTETMVN